MRASRDGGWISALALGAILMLAGCTIKLAPDYDPSIVDGLTKANQDAHVFFASVAAGSDRTDYPKKEGTYDQLIGEIDALRLDAAARPEPPPPEFLGLLASKHPNDAPPQLKSPTPEILGNMAKRLTAMRVHHRDHGLSADDVEDAKLSFDQKMDQALTYEKALKR